MEKPIDLVTIARSSSRFGYAFDSGLLYGHTPDIYLAAHSGE